jgi:hypothetical protein
MRWLALLPFSTHLFICFFFYFGNEMALVETNRDGIAERDLGGVAKNVAGCVGGDSITAGKYAAGTAFFELKA